MSVEERTSTSWFSRIGGALSGAVVGIILVIGAIIALFWNEGRSVATYQALQEGLGAVVSTDAAKINPALEGKLVHIQSDVLPAGDVSDPETGITASGPIGLERHVEMYQWVETQDTKTEKKLGGGEEQVTTYNYTKEWRDSAQDSSGFKQAENHQNPAFWLASSTNFVETAKLGAFTASGESLQSVAARKDHPISTEDADAASEALGYPGEGRALSGALYFGANEKAPEIGDTKITYQDIALPTVSIVGMQHGNGLAEYTTKNKNTLFLLAAGRQTAATMFATGQSENATLTWLIRAGGLVGLFIGFMLIFAIFGVLGDVIPIFGSIIAFGTGLISFVLALAIGATVIAIGWFVARPLLSIGLLTASAAIVFAYLKYGRKKAAPVAA